MPNNASSSRLAGLDLARFIAFAGMVVVNFKVVMGVEEDTGVLSVFTGALEGRAAATFVVLAGVGMGLAAQHSGQDQTIALTLKRALFLLIVGLLNSLIFEADILHYYAFYFLVGAFCLGLSIRALVIVTIAVNILFVFLILILDYDAGWDWNNLTYTGFWTFSGFIRNLVFNGWHPVIPWISFFLIGLAFSRLALDSKVTQARLIFWGIIGMICAEVFSYLSIHHIFILDAEIAPLFQTKPVPPMPLYILAGSGVAATTIGLCLVGTSWAEKTGLFSVLAPAGRQTLTLYIAHILIGMGTLEALGMLENQTALSSLISAIIFCVVAVIYALAWSQLFKRGPIEFLMRKIAG